MASNKTSALVWAQRSARGFYARCATARCGNRADAAVLPRTSAWHFQAACSAAAASRGRVADDTRTRTDGDDDDSPFAAVRAADAVTFDAVTIDALAVDRVLGAEHPQTLE